MAVEFFAAMQAPMFLVKIGPVAAHAMVAQQVELLVERERNVVGHKSSSVREQVHETAEHFDAVLAVERQSKLGGEQPIFDADVVAVSMKLAGKIALTFVESREGGGELDAAIPSFRNFLIQQIHDQ